MHPVKHTELTDVSALTRKDVVPYYVDLIWNGSDAEVVRINNLILAKWTTSGLLWIKALAWKVVDRASKDPF